MLTCKEVSLVISQSLDRDLPLLQRIGMRFHLLYCVACQRYRRQVRFLRLAMDRYRSLAEEVDGVPPVTGSLSPEARQRIKNVLAAGTDRDSF